MRRDYLSTLYSMNEEIRDENIFGDDVDGLDKDKEGEFEEEDVEEDV